MTSWPGVVALLAALVAALLMARATGVRQAPAHNSALDGFRGYLAFGVFLHHGVVWYFHLQDGNWGLPPLVVYRELGLDCVNFFFMITAFLFVGKVIEGRSRPVDWARLYAGRLLRIAPLYLLVIAALLIAVGHATAWHLQESPRDLVVHGLRWLMLGMAGGPPLNAYATTGLLIAFVTWTLAYEWMFYFSLPLIALMLRVRVAPTALAIATAALLLIALGVDELFFPSAFVFGSLTALAARNERVAASLRSHWASFATLLAIVLLLTGAVPHRVAMLIEGAAFCPIACGNGLFGILSNRAAVALGEISYGIYLIHSLLLSTVLLFVIGPDAARALSPNEFWALLVGMGVAVVLLSTMTYRFIEMPALRHSGQLASYLRSLGQRLLRQEMTR